MRCLVVSAISCKCTTARDADTARAAGSAGKYLACVLRLNPGWRLSGGLHATHPGHVPCKLPRDTTAIMSRSVTILQLAANLSGTRPPLHGDGSTAA